MDKTLHTLADYISLLDKQQLVSEHKDRGGRPQPPDRVYFLQFSRY